MRFILRAGAASLILLVCLRVADPKPPPPPPKTMPGKLEGKTRSDWLAPFVHRTDLLVGPTRTTIIRWFSKEGRLQREMAGRHLLDQPGHLRDCSVEGVQTILAVNGDWSFALPKDRPTGGYLNSTPDSRTFIHQFEPRAEQIAVDVYIHGKLVNTLGAYPSCGVGGVHLSEEGSFALLIGDGVGGWKPDRVVVAGADGKVRFETKCKASHCSPIAAPDGRGVLLRHSDGARNAFDYYTKEGWSSSIKLLNNAEFCAWLTGSDQALFRHDGPKGIVWSLIDCKTGKTNWQLDDPNTKRDIHLAVDVVSFDGMFLVSGSEFWDLPKPAPVRRIDALDAKTGKALACWLPSPIRGDTPQGRFLKLEKELYYLTGDEWSCIKAEEIKGKSNGWR